MVSLLLDVGVAATDDNVHKRVEPETSSFFRRNVGTEEVFGQNFNAQRTLLEASVDKMSVVRILSDKRSVNEGQ